LIVYSGRNEALVQPLIDRFEAATGTVVEVRYGGSAQMAAMIIDEGGETPADVYYGQDAGALGSLARKGRLRELPRAILDTVDPRFRSVDGRWVGTSGRARVLAFNTNALTEDELPDSVAGLTEPRWKGRVGWAPTNGSFQAFVSAMRIVDGDDATRHWLAGMVENEPKVYRDNTPLFEAVMSGAVDVGLTNHYYLFRFLEASTGDVPVQNYSPRGGGVGALVNIAGAGIVDTSPRLELAERFIGFLLSEEAQAYFARKTFEYPLAKGVTAHSLITPLSEIRTPAIDLGELDDLEGTLAMLEEVGAL
jgi:iron(III) transport system substrate-binding protein